MYFLVPLQHFDKLPDAPCACRGLLRSLDPPKDGVAIGAVQCAEECLGPRVLVQGRLQIVRHFGVAGRIVCGIPPAVLFGALDLLEPGGLHAARFDQRCGLLAIHL